MVFHLSLSTTLLCQDPFCPNSSLTKTNCFKTKPKKPSLRDKLRRNLLIHTGRGEEYIRDGVLGDALIHEATHTSMDGDHLTSGGWQQAMRSDGIAISRYAADYPTVTLISYKLILADQVCCTAGYVN